MARPAGAVAPTDARANGMWHHPQSPRSVTNTTTANTETCCICTACGTQFSAMDAPPATCDICTDERQYVRDGGQQWTTLSHLSHTHRNAFQRLEPALLGIGTEPSFAIGQRCLLVQGTGGNVLWDCIALIDDATVDILRAMGGLRAIAISHPHYYTTMVEWARAFDCPVYLHESDRRWVMRPDPAIHYWSGDTHALGDGLILIRAGGHFAGGTVMHWAAGADGRGALLSGDILQVVSDGRYVSFMRSYPNLIPLAPATVQRIVDRVAPFQFDRIYGAWWGKHVDEGAAAALRESAERYIRHSTTLAEE